MSANVAALAYLLAGVLFIQSLRGLSSPERARQGNYLGMIGMVIAIGTTLAFDLREVSELLSWELILVGVLMGGGIGTIAARRVPMTDMPQMVALFNSLVGLSGVFIAGAALYSPGAYGIEDAGGGIRLNSRVEMSLSDVVGAITFSGSVIAFAKLQGLMSGAPVVFRFQHAFNALLGLVILGLMIVFWQEAAPEMFWILTALALFAGVMIVIPIGGADMPVVISMLNCYSGWTSVGIGFTLENTALIITGALVGSSGAILSYIMCRAMNRSLLNVMLGGFGVAEGAAPRASSGDKTVTRGSAEDAAFIMKNASSVIIVPGYGMAVAKAQHAVREMADLLKEAGVRVRYAIHPVAGRMPGHMNVLLAEADVSYDDVFALEEINSDFKTTDVAYVIGANDVTNPAARADPSSPIYGMPILDVDMAHSVLFVKRSLSPGYAGVDNELFYRENTMMLFADAKQMTEDIVKAL